jgi:TRAP-type C4-dicarboxylate transport system permease small subunit
MQTLTRAVERAVGWMLVALMSIAVLNVLWQVFTRFVLADPSRFTDELARYLLIWIGLLGAGYAVGRNMHLAIDLLPSKLTGRSRWYLNLLIEASVFTFALAVLVVGGIRLVTLTLTLGQTSAALHVPLGYVYLVLPLSGLLMMFFSIGAVFRHHIELHGSDAPAGKSAESR